MSLNVLDLSVDLGGRRIVSDIDLHVGDGEFAGLLGPNGSGKSTILKAICRVNRPASGRILLDGRDLLALPAREAARRLAVVAQESDGRVRADRLGDGDARTGPAQARVRARRS